MTVDKYKQGPRTDTIGTKVLFPRPNMEISNTNRQFTKRMSDESVNSWV